MRTTTIYAKSIIHPLAGPPKWNRGMAAPRLRRALTLALALSALLTATNALGWPFVTSNWSAPLNDSAMARIVPFQMDHDRRLEFFTGETVLQRDGVDASVNILPEPDTDPYEPNLQGVGFSQARGDVGDIDNDGDLDLIQSSVVSYNSGVEPNFRMMACLNNGNGTYVRGWHWKTYNNALFAYGPPIRLADLDDDGDLDLIEGYNSVRVRWNPGNGNFGNGSTVLDATLFQYFDFQAADFNRDGVIDLAAVGYLRTKDPEYEDAWHHSGRLLLFTGTGNGTFSKTVVTTLPVDQGFTQLEVADMDGDGWVDLVAATLGAPSTLVWRRNTAGTFPAAITLASGQGYSQPIRFAVGDLDEDGRKDVVYSPEKLEIRWLRNAGSGSFDPAGALLDNSPQVPQEATGMALADYDGDGDLDLLCNGGSSFLENTAIHREAKASASEWGGTSPGGTVDLEVADINGDGLTDLIATDPESERLLWYPGGPNTLGSSVPVSASGDKPSSVAAGDLDGDGDTDLAWTNGTQVKRTLNAFGNGIGWYAELAATLAGASRVAIADGDGDGALDLLAASTAGGVVRWYYNNGTATVWSQENVVAGMFGVRRIAVGQTRPGGHPEVHFVLSPINGTPGWREYGWTPQGWNQVRFRNVAPGNATGLVVTDIQGGFPPDAAYSIGGDGVATAPSVYTFQPPGQVRNLASTDWDGDGYNDLLCAHAGGVTIYLHDRASGGTWTPIPALTGVDCADVVTIDLDHDTRMDAVAVQSATGKLFLIRNTSGAVTLTHALAKSDGTAVRVTPGGEATLLTIQAASHGTTTLPLGITKDALAVPETVAFRFRRAVPWGSGYAPSGVMTGAEVAAVIETVSFGGAIATPSAISNGRFTMKLNFFAQGLLTVTAGSTRSYAMGITLRETAASAPVVRFYVEHLAAGVADPSQWRPFSSSSGSAGPVPLPINTDTAMPAALVEVAIPGPLEQWRMSYFNTYESEGYAANDADPDGDGVPNLVEYVLNRNPQVAKEISSGTPVVTLTGQGLHAPYLADLRLFNTVDPRVKVTLEQTSDLKNWSSLSTRTGTGPWTGAQPATAGLVGGRTRFTFTTTGTPATKPHYFVRLSVAEVP